MAQYLLLPPPAFFARVFHFFSNIISHLLLANISTLPFQSSILCAICLGLGGEPKLLGRASDVDTFIKTGEDKAEIEIELVREDGDNVIIQRIIRKDGKPRSAFLWNGEQTPAKEVRERVVEEFNIQIGNLCTFLPQEKVGNFSGFDSRQLLLETEKTIGHNEELFNQHQDLIERQNALLGGTNDVETLEKKLARLESEQVPLRREVERQKNRQKAEEQVELLAKKIIWLKSDAAREKALELKVKRDESQTEVRDAFSLCSYSYRLPSRPFKQHSPTKVLLTHSLFFFFFFFFFFFKNDFRFITD